VRTTRSGDEGFNLRWVQYIRLHRVCVCVCVDTHVCESDKSTSCMHSYKTAEFLVGQAAVFTTPGQTERLRHVKAAGHVGVGPPVRRGRTRQDNQDH
jgi:hypothetical protein